MCTGCSESPIKPKRFIVLNRTTPANGSEPTFGLSSSYGFKDQASALKTAGEYVSSNPKAVYVVAEVTHEVTQGVPNVTKVATE